jgi:hypothetical protein
LIFQARAREKTACLGPYDHPLDGFPGHGSPFCSEALELLERGKNWIWLA